MWVVGQVSPLASYAHRACCSWILAQLGDSTRNGIGLQLRFDDELMGWSFYLVATSQILLPSLPNDRRQPDRLQFIKCPPHVLQRILGLVKLPLGLMTVFVLTHFRL